MLLCTMPIEVTVRSSQLGGRRAMLTLSHNGKALASQPVSYDDNAFAQTFTLPLVLEKAGLQSYTLSLTPVEGELTADNNRRTITVEVLEGRRKVAIVAPAAHPDLGALKQSIESNPNYQVQVAVGTQGVAAHKGDSLKGCDVVILHNHSPRAWAAAARRGLVETSLPTAWRIQCCGVSRPTG